MDESIVKHLVPADLDEASRLLLKAADLIESGGLVQNALCSGTALCINGALSKAMCGDPYGWGGDLDRFIASAAYQRLTKHFNSCPAVFNNAPGRTKEEVVAKLRAVALCG